MKKNINFACGFTMAEILITMLISALVAAAMVPVIGLKKVKFPRNIHNHGVAECYYEPIGAMDENGNYSDWRLMFYHADNHQRKNAVPAPVPAGQNYCTFEVPHADFIEITAIGAGTDGYDTVPIFGTLSPDGQTTDKKGFIRVDSNYRVDIAEAKIKNDLGEEVGISDRLLTLISTWAASDRANELYASYMFDSPIGSGGGAACQAIDRTWDGGCYCTGGRGDLDDPSCPGPIPGLIYNDQISDAIHNGPQCYFYFHGKGQDSGKGGKTTRPLTVPLSSTTNIRIYEDTSRSGVHAQSHDGSTEAFLYASEDGGDAYEAVAYYYHEYYMDPPKEDSKCSLSINGTSLSCQDRLGFEIDDKMIHKGETQGKVLKRDCRFKNGLTKDPGVVYYTQDPNFSKTDPKVKDPRKLKWEYISMKASPQAGTAGSFGNENTVVYENLEGTLFLTPAPYVSGANSNITSVRQTLGDPSTTLVSAGTSNNGKAGELKNMPFMMVTDDMPIPNNPFVLGKKDNFDHFSYVTKLGATVFDNGLKGCNETLSCAGYAGQGQYIYINDLPPVSAIALTNLYNDRSFSVPVEAVFAEKGLNIENPLCGDGRPAVALPPVSYSVPGSTGGTMTPLYCKELKTKGSPGAVVIIW